jgi:hypothetical protein
MAIPAFIAVRLHAAAYTALSAKAAAAGLEVADYAQVVLLRDVGDAIDDKAVGAALIAESELKVEAARLARECSPPEAFDPHATLRVFRAIRLDARLSALYRSAIGQADAFGRGNAQKARVNRAIGSTVKAALDAASTDPSGHTTKVEISGEFCFSYTLLHPNADRAR